MASWLSVQCVFWWHFYILSQVLSFLSCSMQQSRSREANPFSASQEIPRILWNPKVHYRIHKCPPPVPILTQINPVHAPTSHFLKTHLNVFLSPTPGSSKWFLPQVFPPNPVCTARLFHACYLHSPSHSSRFDHLNIIGWAVQIIKLFIVSFSPLLCYPVPLRPKYSPQHPVLKHLSVPSSFNVNCQVSHPHKTTTYYHFWPFKAQWFFDALGPPDVCLKPAWVLEHTLCQQKETQFLICWTPQVQLTVFKFDRLRACCMGTSYVRNFRGGLRNIRSGEL